MTVAIEQSKLKAIRAILQVCYKVTLSVSSSHQRTAKEFYNKYKHILDPTVKAYLIIIFGFSLKIDASINTEIQTIISSKEEVSNKCLKDYLNSPENAARYIMDTAMETIIQELKRLKPSVWSSKFLLEV